MLLCLWSPLANLSQGSAKFRRLPGVPKTFFRVTSETGGLLDAAWGSAAVVSSMIELISMAVGLASAFIFATHLIEAYRA
jgi:hypothetical protein